MSLQVAGMMTVFNTVSLWHLLFSWLFSSKLASFQFVAIPYRNVSSFQTTTYCQASFDKMLSHTKSKMQHQNSYHNESMANYRTTVTRMIVSLLFSGQIFSFKDCGWLGASPNIGVLSCKYNSIVINQTATRPQIRRVL